MASCARSEVSEAVWTGLRRLRDISRLVLAAVERDDLVEIETLAKESEVLLECLKPLFQGRATVPNEVRDLLEDVGRGHARMVSVLARRRDQVAQEIARLRVTRGRLRSLRLSGPRSDPSAVDRDT